MFDFPYDLIEQYKAFTELILLYPYFNFTIYCQNFAERIFFFFIIFFSLLMYNHTTSSQLYYKYL